jgi:hypothetical protein
MPVFNRVASLPGHLCEEGNRSIHDSGAFLPGEKSTS